MLTPLHKQLLNEFQQDFPLTPTPYKDIALALGVEERDVLSAFAMLNDDRFISRIGAVIAPNHIGVSCLVAMAVPDAQLQAVADIVSRHQEVNHNYERENRFNLWFVLIADDEAHLQTVIAQIEEESGFQTMQLPLLADYYINLGFEMSFDD